MIQVLELTPSATGWYFAATSHRLGTEPERPVAPLRSAALVPASHDPGLGYDASGRVRSAHVYGAFPSWASERCPLSEPSNEMLMKNIGAEC
jgi:hypothetical protein